MSNTIGRPVLTMIAVTGLAAGIASGQTTTERNQDKGDQKTWSSTRDGATVGAAKDMHLQKLQPLVGEWDVTLVLSGAGTTAADRQQISGTATRNWTLENTVVQEELRLNQMPPMPGEASRATGSQAEPGAAGGAGADNDVDDYPLGDRQEDDGETGAVITRDRNRDVPGQIGRTGQQSPYKGLGLFTYDKDQNQFSHVWTDSMGQGIILSVGQYNESGRTFTFRTHSGEETGERYARDGQRPGADRDRPGTDRPGIGEDEDQPVLGREEPQFRMGQEPVVTLNVISNDKHVVKMSKPGADGTTQVCEITYTRKGAARTPGMNQNPGQNPGQGQDRNPTNPR